MLLAFADHARPVAAGLTMGLSGRAWPGKTVYAAIKMADFMLQKCRFVFGKPTWQLGIPMNVLRGFIQGPLVSKFHQAAEENQDH